MSTSSTTFSGSIPENYDRCLGPLLFEPYALDLASRIPKKRISSVLELACGTGRVTFHLGTLLPGNTLLVASDLNPDMLAAARTLVVRDHIRWETIDMQSIPFEADSFDLVVCQFGIMFVPDKAKAFGEIFRVLKKGGLLLLNTWDKLENNRATLFAHQVINQFFKDNPVSFFEVPFSFHDKKSIEKHLSGAGFTSFQVSLVKKMGASEKASDAAWGLVEGTPVIDSIVERNAGLVPAIREALEKELVKQLGDNPLKSPLQAWVVEAIK